MEESRSEADYGQLLAATSFASTGTFSSELLDLNDVNSSTNDTVLCPAQTAESSDETDDNGCVKCDVSSDDVFGMKTEAGGCDEDKSDNELSARLQTLMEACTERMSGRVADIEEHTSRSLPSENATDQSIV